MVEMPDEPTRYKRISSKIEEKDDEKDEEKEKKDNNT